MARPKGTTYTAVEAALIAAGGNLSAASRRVGITRQSVLSWLKRYPALAEIAQAQADMTSDTAEGHLITLVLAGDIDACCYWLEAKRPDTWRRARTHRASQKH